MIKLPSLWRYAQVFSLFVDILIGFYNSENLLIDIYKLRMLDKVAIENWVLKKGTAFRLTQNEYNKNPFQNMSKLDTTARLSNQNAFKGLEF